MPTRVAFEYATIRVVPSIARGEFVNVGVLVFCRTRRFLGGRVHLDAARLHALAPGMDTQPVQAMLDHIVLLCAGGVAAGPLGELPVQERFRWLVAPRSTVVQPGPVHCGLCDDPAAVLARLAQVLVLPAAE